jgi:2-C-methyl-D-erythritol 4-phosphate cytidylyltransferase
MGGPASKQYVDLAGLPILACTLRVFQSMEQIDGIIVVAPRDDIAFVKESIVDRYGFSKVMRVVAGGKEDRIP